MTVSDIIVGSFLYFARYPIRHRNRIGEMVWRKATESNGFLLDRPLSMCFDANEPKNPNGDIAANGNPYFPTSNLNQYLNATDRDWFHPQSEYDNADATMAKCPGFLHAFADWELQAIVPHQVVTILPPTPGNESETLVETTQRVSILSRSQIFGTGDQREGRQIELYTSGDCSPLPHTFTRTSMGSKVCWIDGAQGEGAVFPNLFFNVQPYIEIDGSYPVVFDERSGTYFLIPPQEVANSIVDELNNLNTHLE